MFANSDSVVFSSRRGAALSLLASFWMVGNLTVAGLAWAVIPHTTVWPSWRVFALGRLQHSALHCTVLVSVRGAQPAGERCPGLAAGLPPLPRPQRQAGPGADRPTHSLHRQHRPAGHQLPPHQPRLPRNPTHQQQGEPGLDSKTLRSRRAWQNQTIVLTHACKVIHAMHFFIIIWNSGIPVLDQP